jgi:hypothetical protein
MVGTDDVSAFSAPRVTHTLVRPYVVPTVPGCTANDRLSDWSYRVSVAWGPLTRVAAKLSACNMALWINHRFERPTFAVFKPLAYNASCV